MDVSDPMLCCVTPIAQRMQTPSASAIRPATFSNVSMGRPQVWEATHGEWARLFGYASKPFTHW